MTIKENRELFYNQSLDYIKETYQDSKDWNKVISIEFLNIDISMEAFIDYVEETYKTKIKDNKHLQKLTGITVKNLEELEDVIIKANCSKYTFALETALENGANYKELLKIEPKDFNLPETWSGGVTSDKISSILYTINTAFFLDEWGGLMLYPDIRSIAKEIEAPYSVIMEAFNINQY